MAARRRMIGITAGLRDNQTGSKKYESATAYSTAVLRAGGTPLILPHALERVGEYVRLCDGFILTGGNDPAMEMFGKTTDPRASVMDPDRQHFEIALLKALDALPRKPVLGICLGMQLMALHHGGDLHQHLPDQLGERAAIHMDDQQHPLAVVEPDSVLWGNHQTQPTHARDAHDAAHRTAAQSQVTSWHRQAVSDAGRLRVVATAPDGVIEAIDDPDRLFYVGVQWHPERGEDGPLNFSLFERLLSVCRGSR